jgi:hypothetical protein
MCCLGLTLPTAAQETPRDQLLRLVPDDVGVCLVINDLRGHSDKLARSPWIKMVRQSPLGKALADAPELRKLFKLEEHLKKSLHITWPQLRDGILGDAVVLAYRPGPPGKPELEQGMLLLHAPDKTLLAKLIERLNQEQTKSGELKQVQPREHKGHTYHRRVETAGESFYFLDGPLLAFTGHEALLKQLLERRAQPANALKILPLAAQARKVGVEKALGTLWINPRSFDAEFESQLTQLQGPEAAVLKTFLSYWRAIEGITVSMLLEADPEFVLSVQARTASLPPAAQRLVIENAKPSELWRRFPEKSVLTFAGRIDAPALLETLAEFMTPEARKDVEDAFQRTMGIAVREHLLKEVLPYLGPDVGVCVMTPPDKKSFPHVLAALRVQPGSGKTPVDQALVKTLHFFTSLAVLDYNLKQKGQQMWLKTVVQDKVETHYLVNDAKFPAGFQPSFALKEGYLLLASSPDAIRHFRAGPVAAMPVTKDIPLLRLALPELSRLLTQRRDSVISLLAKHKQIPPELAGELLAGLTGFLDLFETLELSQRTEAEHVIWLIRLRTAAPKK